MKPNNGNPVTVNGGTLVNQRTIACICDNCGVGGANVSIPPLAPASFKRLRADLIMFATSQGWLFRITEAMIVKLAPALPEVVEFAATTLCPECRVTLDAEARHERDVARTQKAESEAKQALEASAAPAPLRLVGAQGEAKE